MKDIKEIIKQAKQEERERIYKDIKKFQEGVYGFSFREFDYDKIEKEYLKHEIELSKKPLWYYLAVKIIPFIISFTFIYLILKIICLNTT